MTCILTTIVGTVIVVVSSLPIAFTAVVVVLITVKVVEHEVVTVILRMKEPRVIVIIGVSLYSFTFHCIIVFTSQTFIMLLFFL